MAALSDTRAALNDNIVELRNVDADRLSKLLDEEIGVWRAELDWDFRMSADLVRRFVHMQALTGYAIVTNTSAGPRVDGYAYYVCEDGKGLIGDLYVAREQRTPDRENALLGAVLSALWRTPGVKRIEAQLLMLSSPLDRARHEKFVRREFFRAFPRVFLEAPLTIIDHLPAKPQAGIAISAWTERLHDQSARLIANAYQGHLDSQINDQYRSPSGARRFLTNIVQYPGCGTFFAPASFAAIDSSKQLRGISLASLVAQDCGHITQVCVARADQGTGLGYELMRQSLAAMRGHGCRMVSLTVTTANESAIRLYQRMGFTPRREFAAYVWDPAFARLGE